MIYLLKFMGVMLAMAITDVCWAYYFIKVEERRPLGAGSVVTKDVPDNVVAYGSPCKVVR